MKLTVYRKCSNRWLISEPIRLLLLLLLSLFVLVIANSVDISMQLSQQTAQQTPFTGWAIYLVHSTHRPLPTTTHSCWQRQPHLKSISFPTVTATATATAAGATKWPTSIAIAQRRLFLISVFCFCFRLCVFCSCLRQRANKFNKAKTGVPLPSHHVHPMNRALCKLCTTNKLFSALSFD